MKTILITGASSGIGKATALFFQKKGWNVAATMRNTDKGKDLSKFSNVKCFPLNVSDRKSIKKAVDDVIKNFGTIDVLLNNAGFSLIGPFETTEENEIMRQYNTNVFGLMHVIREVLPIFRENKQGTIINVASIGGRVGFPLYSLYNSTKFAVEGFSESLQWELQPFNIRIKIIEPGIIKTDFYGRSMINTSSEKSPYAEFAQSTIEKLMKMEKTGIGPEKVAKTIFKAANSNRKRMRYSIGTDAKAVLFLKRMIPFRLLRLILKNTIGIK